MKVFAILGILAIAMLMGCAAHTVHHDLAVKSLVESWLNQPIDRFLDVNPDVRDPIPIGQGRYRYTYVHDVVTEAEIGTAFWSEGRVQRNDFYYLYLYVNNDGIIYKVDYSRRTATR